MRFLVLRTAALAAWLLFSTSFTSAQQPTGSPCPKCGKIHAQSLTAENSFESTSLSGVANVLHSLNAQRARQGIGSLRYDPTLQAVAERRAQQMAARGLKSHPPGSFSPGRYEGVGWSSSYSPSGVSACYTSDPNMQYAGAAMATGRDGVYFAVVYR
jgi:uncharacterized protein YkwD